MWGVYRRNFYCMNSFPWSSGPARALPLWSYFRPHVARWFFYFIFFIHDPTWHTVLTLENCFIAYWITDFPKWCLRIVESKYFTSAGHRRKGKNAKYKELNQSLNGIYVVRSFSFPIWNLLPVLFSFLLFKKKNCSVSLNLFIWFNCKMRWHEFCFKFNIQFSIMWLIFVFLWPVRSSNMQLPL